MPLDGISLRCLREEFNMLVGAKINRVNQPKKLDLVLNLYKKDNYKLFLTANAANARINLIDKSPENPMTPPNFCMVLRKHIQGGVIKSFEQFKLDRVLKMDIETYDEMGYKVRKSLIIEIMGRHSNIILIDENNTIIDSLIKVNSSMSRVREVLPGKKYFPLEDQKINLLLEDKLPSQAFDLSSNGQAYKDFYKTYIGMSPALAREIFFITGLDPCQSLSSLELDDLKSLDQSFIKIREQIRSNDFKANIFTSKDGKSMIDFYPLELTHLQANPVEYKSLNDALDSYFNLIIKTDKLKDKSENLKKVVKNNISYISQRLDDMVRGMEKAKDREKYKVYADVLSANLHLLKGGEESLTAQNFYSENLKPITIPLDKTKSGPQNAQRYYKLYSKLKTRESKYAEEIPKMEDELFYLKQIISAIDNSEELQDLKEIEEELQKQAYIKQKQNKKQKHANKDKLGQAHPLKFEATNGDLIYVGKNNKQNDYITLKLANKDDYFFHIQQVPGSHVILKLNKELSKETILEAAYLAGHYSSLRNEKIVTVDYTQKKNVYKAKGAKPGMVYYNDFSSISIDLTDENLGKILDKRK